MTIVHRFNGYRVVIWLNDHRPAHVHVIGKGGEAVFKLHCPEGPPELREVYGLSTKQVKDILEKLTELLSELCEGWSEIHGQF